MKIRKGDKVLVDTGGDKGKKSKVLRAIPDENRVVVEGVNIVKKRIRPQKEGEKGKTVETPSPIDVSNIRLICDNCGEPTRVGYDIGDGEKVRVCKKCKKET